MAAKKIIACLDVKNGRTVKGVNFVNIKDAGDPVELAALYVSQGADELVFLDITATNEKRKTMADLVRKVAEKVTVPFTVGGGMRSVEDVRAIMEAGADKVSINSAAVGDPDLINRLVKEFGSRAIVIAVDVKSVEGQWKVTTHGGKKVTSWKAIDWGKEIERRGAGAILLTSMDHDGTHSGFAVDITGQLADELTIPVIASGGAGKMEDFVEVFEKTKVSAALAAGIFHFKEVEIPALKRYLRDNGIEVKMY